MANTYYVPGLTTASGATNPTAAQASRINLLVVDVVLADASTTFEITHNWGGVINLSFSTLFPLVMRPLSLNATATIPSAFTISYDSTNTVQLTKLSTAAGSGGTYRVTLMRPWSGLE